MAKSQGRRIKFRINHPLMPTRYPFDSWMTLKEVVTDHFGHDLKIVDEIMATAEEANAKRRKKD